LVFVRENPDTAVGGLALQFNWDAVLWGLENEDTFAMWLNHFWDPDTDAGLPGCFSARIRANNLWTEMLNHYRAGRYESAYRDLGRIAHLIQDMGVPAHTLLDCHAFGDDYEEYVRDSANLPHSAGGLVGGGNVECVVQIMFVVAEISDNYDSEEGVGEIYNFYNDDELTDDEADAIAEACIPLAEEGTAALFRLFYDYVQPVSEIILPDQGRIYSGAIGIPFVARAHSYDKQWQDADYIEMVDFDFAEEDTPQPRDWTNAGSDDTLNEENHYEFTWNFKGFIGQDCGEGPKGGLQLEPQS
jgi:hypothetical protein